MALFIKITTRSENIIRMAAEIDTLTGINNRSKMLEFFHTESEFIFEQSKDMLVVMIDIDDFKNVNDTYGHQAGDYVLRQVALSLKALEDQDLQVCRWGGEEFLIFGIGDNIYEDTKIKLEQLIKTICRKKFFYKGTEIPITITAGLARHKDEGSIEDLIQEADKNLYAGKRIGKNQLICS
jgi:diguanylate cyclase